ncbi:Transcription factor TGA2 [Heracleum sosnowskyi]|uniref:Transcription factor TGA2 n=1 Tax=Heracleum sosnowskyi TaxID=360622 RepID=A0AAD8IVR4_9APIA|nr:Transcription factor TGA2 [Heracleum sosnowskyi]
MATSGQSSMDVVPQSGTFQNFLEKWTAQLRNDRVDLVSAIPDVSADHTGLIKRVMDHYEEYFRVKSYWAKQDVLLMFNPTWTSPLERAFSWIAGWRPILAIHLLYTLSGFQLGDLINEHGLNVPTDLIALSPVQVAQMDELHRRTVEEEKEISEEKGNVDMIVELDEERIESAFRKKEEGLERVLRQADELRLRTLKGIVEIVTPSQGVKFLVAAVDFQLGLHDWGRQMEGNQPGGV